MSIYKPKGSVYWHFDFQIKRRRFYGSTGCTSEREAKTFVKEQKEAARFAVVKADAQPKSAVMTVGSAFERYWEEKGRFAKRSDDIEWCLDWIKSALGADTPISHIDDSEVARIISKRRGEPVVNKKAKKLREVRTQPKLVGPARVNRSVTELLRRILRRATTLWRQNVQPIQWKEHILKEPAERIRELTADEETRLFAALPAAYHVVIKVVLRTGLRLSEIALLRTHQIDWGNRCLVFTGKGDQRLTVPMSNEVRNLLWSIKGQHKTAVFLNTEGNPLRVMTLSSAVRRSLKRAKIVDFRFHDTRHTAATRLLRSSGNLKMAQRLLNHKEISTTTKYAHVLDADLRRELEVLEAKAKSPEVSPEVTGRRAARSAVSG